MKKINKKILIVLFLILNSFPKINVQAADDANTIKINSAAELVELSKNASLDSWSKDKTIQLEKDIDLSQVDFEGIPIFYGTFDGQGYTIKGLKLKKANSPQGFFRYLKEDGVIKNVTIEGSVTPDGIQEEVGGLVGHNSGLIKNVEFKGNIEGNKDVGGLVGFNDEKGQIKNSLSAGKIYGEHRVGGIVGNNEGEVLISQNEAEINTIVRDDRFDIKDLNDIYNDKLGALAPANVVDILDIGGIAGYSSGIIKSSTNYGLVGYEQVGYNVGGIVGRQDGYLDDVTNYGKINGRKDIGGIVGQLEPHTSWDFSKDTLAQLKTELETLDRLVNKGIEDTSQFTGSVNQEFQQTKQYLDQARTTSETLVDHGENWLDSNIENVNNLSSTIGQFTHHVQPIASSAVDLLAGGNEALKEYNKMLADAKKSLAEVDKELAEKVEELIKINQKIEGEFQQITDSIDKIQGNLEDDTVLKEEIEKIKTALKNIVDQSHLVEKTIQAIIDKLKTLETEDISKENIEKLVQPFEQIKKSIQNGKAELEKIYVAFEKIEATDDLEELFANAADAIQASVQMIQSIKNSTSDFKNIFALSFDIFDNVEKSDELKQAINKVNTAINKIDTNSQNARKYFENKGGIGDVQFERMNPEMKHTTDDLFQSLAGVSNSMAGLNDSLTDGSQQLKGNVKSITNQLYVIFDLILDTANNLSKTSVDMKEHTEDISMEETAEFANGKIENIKNHGIVAGDTNVGGIVGAIGLEFEFDLEDDYTITEKITTGAKYLTRAVVVNSKNEGQVTAKKDHVGGIVGLMDMGYVVNAQDYGTIESKDGNYVGGIAGKAQGVLDQTYAKSTLAGKEYVGGVAGQAEEILNSYTIVKINEGEEFIGAVAGNAPDENKYKKNYFVHEDYGAINDISYKKHAEPMYYEDILQEKNIPSRFKNFQLEFVVDEEVIDVVEFAYGENLAKEDIPKFPEKEGYYGEWDRDHFKNLKYDEKIQGEYKKYKTTLASKEKREKDLATILVDGEFTNESELLTEKLDLPKKEQKRKNTERWEVEATNNHKDEKTIHFLPSDKKFNKFSVYAKNGQGWTKIDYDKMGRYLVFTLNDKENAFEVRQSKKTNWLLVISLLILMVGLVGWFVYKNRKINK